MILKNVIFVYSIFLLSVSLSSYAEGNFELRTVSQEHKLLQYIEDGELKGPSAEIFKLLMAESHLYSEIEFQPWSRAYNVAKNRPNTLIMSMVRTKERENNFVWLIKVSELVRSFITFKKDNLNHINSFEQAVEKKIAVVGGSYSYHLLVDKGFKKLHIVESITEAIRIFEINEADLIFTDPTVIRNHYMAKGLDSTTIVNAIELPETRKSSYIAINVNSDKALIEKLSKAAKKVQQYPQYQQLVEHKPLLEK
jgi:ABC-type amino acid transport substrate-binding protein